MVRQHISCILIDRGCYSTFDLSEFCFVAQRYLGTAREEDSLNILLEFVPGGSIASLLGKFGSFPESVSDQVSLHKIRLKDSNFS